MRILTCLLLISFTRPCTAMDEPEFRASPPTTSESFPEANWKPVEGEAKSWKGPFAAALRIMFDAGLPDPAGLPYHRIGIPTGNCYTGDSGITQTEGWILPGKEDNERYAIAWNGLVYPLAEVGGVADLNATVARIMKIGEKERASWYETEEPTRVDPASLSLIHCLYLTRLGFPDAAEYVVKNRDTAIKAPPPDGEIALDWVWSHYERAVSAHMRGDPKMVLASLAVLKRSISALEKTLKTVDRMFGDSASWAEDAETMIKESDRRLKSGKTGILDAKAFVAQEPGVADLIDALDRIQMDQSGQPGDVPLWESPVVKALVDKGNEALEPLLDCLERDTRLTQSVHFWRSHHKSRTILGVHEAALYALQDSLNADFFQLASTGDSLTSRTPEFRKRLAAGIRANWEKYGRISGPERAYAVLKNDSAGAQAWIEASGSLLHKEEYDEEAGERIPPKGPMPGEVLRERNDPSVSALMERRIAEVGKLAAQGDKDADDNGVVLTTLLVEWDSAWSLAKLEYNALTNLIGFWKERKLIDSEPFRTMVLKSLTERSPCAWVGVDSKEPDRWYLENDTGTIHSKKPEDPKFALKPGDKVSVRRMDVVARSMQESPNKEENPPQRLEYYWTEKNRDEWIAKAAEELRNAKPDNSNDAEHGSGLDD